MRIIWCRVSSPNLVRSTDFSLLMKEKPRSQTAVFLLIVIIILSKTVNTLISLPLRQTKFLYPSVRFGFYLALALVNSSYFFRVNFQVQG